jgi:hypothetical protein
MLETPKLLLWIGFAVACVGFAALNYANFGLRKRLGLGIVQKIPRTEVRRAYRNQTRARWPFYIAAVCIPLGILLAFSAIVYNNHVRLK